MSQYTHAAVAPDGRVDRLLAFDTELEGFQVVVLPLALPHWPIPPHPAAELYLIGGLLTWVDPRTPDQRSADARTARDALLAACDWRVTRAIEQGQPLDPDWLLYRQALRDISEQAGFPDSIVWPTAPTET